LVDELGYCNFSQVAMRLVSNQSHRKNVAKCGRYKMGILADEKFQTPGEIFVGRHSFDFKKFTI
jgi:hypothetical protein